MKGQEQTKKRDKNKENLDDESQNENFLILHNDDIHTFDFVIDSLINICDHGIEQATQCTYLIHYKGKCDVKKGSIAFLKPLKEKLINRGLRATID